MGIPPPSLSLPSLYNSLPPSYLVFVLKAPVTALDKIGHVLIQASSQHHTQRPQHLENGDDSLVALASKLSEQSDAQTKQEMRGEEGRGGG